MGTRSLAHHWAVLAGIFAHNVRMCSSPHEHADGFKTATRESKKTGNAKHDGAAVSVYWDLLPDLLSMRSEGTTLRGMNGEHSSFLGSRGNPCSGRKCLPFKVVPASRLVIRT